MRLESQTTIEFRDLTDFVKWLKIALAALAIMSLTSAYTNWLQLGSPAEIHGGGSSSQDLTDLNDVRGSVVSFVYSLTSVVTAILFLRWTYLAKRNVLALGSTNQRISPGWSVGYYFIPILNLWKPYQALKEAFEGSHPNSQYTRNERSRPALMPLWWILWLVSSTLGDASSGSYNPHLVAWSGALANLIELPLIAVVWILISMMLDWQTTKSETSREPLSSQPPVIAKEPGQA